MQIFENANKVNFIDENNVLIGYDTDQQCCEDAGWFISRTTYGKDSYPDGDPVDLPGWVFDIDWDEAGADYGQHEYEYGEAIFRLTNGTDEMFLHLHNTHNGYYGHGWSVKRDNKEIDSGSI